MTPRWRWLSKTRDWLAPRYGTRSVLLSCGSTAVAAVSVVLAAAVFVSCRGKDEQEQARVVTVDVAPVLLSTIHRTIRAQGLVHPRQQAAIVPKATAPIKKAYVQRGAHVRAGQLLLELENRDLEGTAAENRAAYELAEANYETASRATVPQEVQKAQLGYSRITSPIDGVVTDLPFYPGEMPPNAQPIVTVMDVSQVIARTHVSQSEAAELAVGDAANLIGSDGIPVPAKVTQISPALDASSTTVEVWIEAGNQDGKLRPGASLRVEMIAKTVASALVIPQAAVLTSPSGATFAMVIDNDNKPHRRKIAVGIRDAGRVQVTDGLDSSQRVATTGAFELFKLEDEILAQTKVQIAPTKAEEEPEET